MICRVAGVLPQYFKCLIDLAESLPLPDGSHGSPVHHSPHPLAGSAGPHQALSSLALPVTMQQVLQRLMLHALLTAVLTARPLLHSLKCGLHSICWHLTPCWYKLLSCATNHTPYKDNVYLKTQMLMFFYIFILVMLVNSDAIMSMTNIFTWTFIKFFALCFWMGCLHLTAWGKPRLVQGSGEFKREMRSSDWPGKS